MLKLCDFGYARTMFQSEKTDEYAEVLEEQRAREAANAERALDPRDSVLTVSDLKKVGRDYEIEEEGIMSSYIGARWY